MTCNDKKATKLFVLNLYQIVIMKLGTGNG